ncbi:MAG: TPM domain-containing protein [Flavobacteriales bacterium]
MKKHFLFLFLFGLSTSALFGQYPEPQAPPRFLNNFSKEAILSADEMAKIEERLDRFEQETSNEIAIVIVDDINNDEPWHYATQLAEKWGIGKADKDNGLVFLIKPNQENGGRQVFLAPGRGLEGAITDLACHDIVQNELLPQFKEGNYATGINQALDVLFGLAKGEINEKSYRDRLHKNNKIGGIIGLLIILLVLYLLIKRGGGGTTLGGRSRGPGFFYFGGFGGSGFGGGSSGGGFGGFGGGSFGGGGSGGSW